MGIGDYLARPGDARPAILPHHRHQEGLPPGVEIVAEIVGPNAQEHGPPFPARRRHEARMPGRCNRPRPPRRQVALGQDRIAFERRIWAIDPRPLEYHLRMLLGGAALGSDQVISAVLPEDVRAFDPDRVALGMRPRIDQQARLADGLQGREVELSQPQRGMPFVARLARRWGVVDDPCAAVVVEKQRGIDSFDIGQPDGVRPRAGRIARGQQIIAAAASAGIEQVEGAVVVAEVGSVNALPHVGLVELELA